MISTVDIILKKLAKNRQKHKSKHGYEHSSGSDEESEDDIAKEIPVVPKPAARTSKRQPVRKESSSDDSASLQTAQQVIQAIQKEQKQHRPSIDSVQSQDWKETRQHVKNRSTKSNVETKRKKKTKNVRSSTRSNKGKSSSRKKVDKYVEDVQSDDEARGREPINTLSKRFKSVDMLNSAKDFDVESQSDSKSSLSIQKEERKGNNNQLSKNDSQSDSSLRRREEERKIKHKQLYLELKRRQEQERKEKLMEQKKSAEYERHRLESGGSVSPNTKRIVQALRLGDTSTTINAPASNSNVRPETDTELESWPGTSLKHMVLENSPTGARSKHHVTSQAVIEHSIRQSARRSAGPAVPSKPNKIKANQEIHTFTTLPPVSSENFQRGYRSGSPSQGASVPTEVRGSYRPQQQQHSAADTYRPATLSHSRRYDYNKPPPSNYEMNQQWHQEAYQSLGYEHNPQYSDQRLNQEIPSEERVYHHQEYEKYTPSYNPASLPRDTHHRNHNRLVSDEVPFDPRYQDADLV